MEAELDNLLVASRQALAALEGPLAPEVDASLRLNQDPASSAQSGALRAKIQETIQTLGELEKILTPPQVQFMDAIFAATNTKVLVCAAQYRLADILASKGPLPVAELAREAGMQPTACGQIVRFLDEMGFFTRRRRGEDAAVMDVVANNRTSELLRTDHWTTWHNWVGQYAGEHYDILARLPDAVAAGQRRTAAQVFYDTDEPIYAVMERLGMTAGFHRAIGAFSIAEAPGLMADYPWAAEVRDEVVMDVGAGAGDFVWHYLAAFPHGKAAAFDLPATADLIRARFEGADEAMRKRLVAVHGGDFFSEKDLPPSAVYFLKFVLHNWDDEHCVTLLKKLRRAIIPKEGVSRVLIGEHVVFDGRRGSFARYADIRMLSRVNNRERTIEEYRSLAEQGGFRVHDVLLPRGCLTQVLDLRPL